MSDYGRRYHKLTGRHFWEWSQPWVWMPALSGMSALSFWLMDIFIPSSWPLALVVTVLFASFGFGTVITWLTEGRPR